MVEADLELYVHVPFCAKKCGYCDFLSECRTYEDQQKYFERLLEELTAASVLAEQYRVSSVFIGGGTPSIVEPQMIAAVMDVIRSRYRLAEDAEVTIEVNPGSTLRHKFAQYREAGINRLSIGLQSADNRELKILGRIHTFEEFLKCYQGARMEGFDNINIDLISCFPTQTPHSWKKTLKNVLMLKPEHVSVYNLIVEEGTPFCELIKEGRLELPSEEEAALIDSETAELLASKNYRRYEISNYAREGYECRHNKGYWTGKEYLGFGLGASSYFGGWRFKNETDFCRYLESDQQFADAYGFLGKKFETERLSDEERMKEFMILGLRLTEGVSTIDFYTRFGRQLGDVYGNIISKYERTGLIIEDGYSLHLSDRGLDISNMILSEF